MYKCQVCRRTSPPKAAKIVYKETELCSSCYETVKALEQSTTTVAELVARDVIASLERQPGSPEISWPR